MDRELVKNLALECQQPDGSIDIVHLASKLDISVYGEEGENFNARIRFLQEKNQFEILVNAKHALSRQRFSIAHEIAHSIIHRDLLKETGSLDRNPNDNPTIEKEADELAEELLIPQKIIYEKFLQFLDQKEEILLSKIQEIATYFKVSLIVAAIRLRNLNWKVPYISYSYSS